MKKNFVREATTVFVISAVVALLALLPAVLPYGGRFITRGDYLEQQIAFILESRSGFLSGGAYSPTTFLGAGLIGSYSFYTLGSAFVWPLWLLPEKWLLYGVSVMAVLKHAVAALTAYLYLRKMRLSHKGALAGGLMYAFSSFTLINAQFYHFTDVVAFFPLMLLGLEDAASEKRHFGALALACAVNALTNYYFYVSSAVLTALYFAVRFFSSDWKTARSFKWLVSVVFECGCGSMLAGVLLVPSAIAALSFTRTSGVNAFDLTKLYEPSDLFERVRAMLMPIESGVEHAFYGDAASWASVAAYIPVFGAAAIMPMKKRRSFDVLVMILVAVSLYPAANAVFSGGTSILYARWWYGLCLILALRAAFALETASAKTLRLCGAAALVVVTGLTLPFLLPQSVMPPILARFVMLRTTGETQMKLRVLSLCMLAVHYGLYFACCVPKKRTMNTAVVAVCVAAIVHFTSFLAVNDAVLPVGGNAEDGRKSMTLHEMADRVMHCMDTRSDETVYTHRVDSDGTVRNFGLLRNQMSISAFHSLRSGYVSPFVAAAGFGFNENPLAMPSDLNGGIRTFLSVKEYYAFDADTPAPEGFVLRGVEDELFVYENENYLPMGFFYPSYTVKDEQATSPDKLADTLLTAVMLEKDAAKKYEGKLAHETVMQPWKEAAAVRRETASRDFVMTSRGFTATIEAPQAGFVFFSVPYDKGFTAYVDGEKTTFERANLSFMAVYVEAGTHEIEFTYRTRGLSLGVAASLAAALVLIAYVALMRRAKHKGGRAWN